MAPLVVLVTSFGVLIALGYAGTPFVFGWWTALRLALATMFLLTASAHWGKRRADLVHMIPPAFPDPEALATVTGILEILGAAGLVWSAMARYAALALSVMLLAFFPANVHAARMQMSIAGSPVPSLLPRTLMQIVFVAACIAVFLGGKR
jgi:uncharacterized membrane protein